MKTIGIGADDNAKFVYQIVANDGVLIKEIKDNLVVYETERKRDFREVIWEIGQREGQIKYHGLNNTIFKDNLVLLDSRMDEIIAETLLYFYRDGITKCSDLVKKLEEENPLNFGNTQAYCYKFMRFLTSVALGMRTDSVWTGKSDVNEGYTILTKSGDILSYNFFNKDYFEDYLLENTEYENVSSSGNNFFQDAEGKIYFVLSLQIHF